MYKVCIVNAADLCIIPLLVGWFLCQTISACDVIDTMKNYFKSRPMKCIRWKMISDSCYHCYWEYIRFKKWNVICFIDKHKHVMSIHEKGSINFVRKILYYPITFITQFGK